MKRFRIVCQTNNNMRTYFSYVKIMGIPTIMFEYNERDAAVYYEHDLNDVETTLIRNMSLYAIRKYRIEWL